MLTPYDDPGTYFSTSLKFTFDGHKAFALYNFKKKKNCHTEATGIITSHLHHQKQGMLV